MAGDGLQGLHHLKLRVCRTMPASHTGVSPWRTLREDGLGNFVLEVECQNSRIYNNILFSYICSSALYYSTWTRLSKVKSPGPDLLHYFTSTAKKSDHIVLCTYPLLSTTLLGLFAAVLTAYLFWLGRQILKLVLN